MPEKSFASQFAKQARGSLGCPAFVLIASLVFGGTLTQISLFDGHELRNQTSAQLHEMENEEPAMLHYLTPLSHPELWKQHERNRQHQQRLLTIQMEQQSVSLSQQQGIPAVNPEKGQGYFDTAGSSQQTYATDLTPVKQSGIRIADGNEADSNSAGTNAHFSTPSSESSGIGDGIATKDIGSSDNKDSKDNNIGRNNSSSSGGGDSLAGGNSSNATGAPNSAAPSFSWRRRADRALLSPRQASVSAAIAHAWQGYKLYAFGWDELHPLTQKGGDWFTGAGLGLTLVDSLDLLWLVGDVAGFEEAREWVATHMVIDKKALGGGGGSVNVFEATIRCVGGLLSAFHVSGDELFLRKAAELGEKLKGALESDSGVPFSDVNLGTGVGFNPRGGPSCLAEAGTVQLELGNLAHLTGDQDLRRKVAASNRAIARARAALMAANSGRNNAAANAARDGLLPVFLDPRTGMFSGAKTITLGARGDSYYEYLLKQWLGSNKTEPHFLAAYRVAVRGIKKHLVRTTSGGATFVGELLLPEDGGDAASAMDRYFSPKMDHLACFLAGTLALGHAHGASSPSALPASPSHQQQQQQQQSSQEGLEKEGGAGKERAPVGDEHSATVGGEGDDEDDEEEELGDDLSLAVALAETCVRGYDDAATGLSAEISWFQDTHHPPPNPPSDRIDDSDDEDDGGGGGGSGAFVKPADAFSLLRPETAESLFYLWRVTKDERWREAGWRMFLAFERHARVPSGGYASVEWDVTAQSSGASQDQAGVRQRDKMESFWLGETLKYLFLLFDDQGLLPIDEVVFNTEAHPLPIWTWNTELL